MVLIVVGLVLCICWIKTADSNRERRLRREAAAARTKSRYEANPCPTAQFSDTLLTIPEEVSLQGLILLTATLI